MRPEMDKREALQMMGRCLNEIRMLRAQNAELKPKADAYDNISKLLSMVPTQGLMGYSEDLAWALEKRMKELQAEEANDAQPSSTPV